MFPGIKIRQAHGKIYFKLLGQVYVPMTNSMLGEHDVVTVSDEKRNGTRQVFIKHYPPETWVCLE